MSLNNKLHDSFKQRGFVIAKKIIDIELIERYLMDIYSIIRMQLAYLDQPTLNRYSYYSLIENMISLLSLDTDAYLSTVRLCSRANSMKKILLHQKIEDIVKSFGLSLPVTQTDPVFHIMGHRLRIPGGYMGFEAHQDWTALQSSLDLVVIWVPLVDIDINRFPLEVIPCSHLQGLAPGVETKHVYQIDSKGYKNEDFMPLEAKRGDVVLMSGFTVHRTGTNGDDRIRLACSHRYENANEATYIKRLYPLSQKKIIERKIITKNFPSKKQISDIYK